MALRRGASANASANLSNGNPNIPSPHSLSPGGPTAEPIYVATSTSSSTSNPALLGFPQSGGGGGGPRSASPSTGFAWTRPSKWFSRSSSNPNKIPTSSSSSSKDSKNGIALGSAALGVGEPRSSTSSVAGGLGIGVRKHKISRPTDPRPILDAHYSVVGGGVGARWVILVRFFLVWFRSSAVFLVFLVSSSLPASFRCLIFEDVYQRL
jgi:hypothetical protein